MEKILIDTITPVHVGSGEILRYGTDFVRGRITIDEDIYDAIGIVDARKLLCLIGEENLGKWVSSIERGVSTSDLVKGFKPNAGIEDYCSRTLFLLDDGVRHNDTLREQLHDGFLHPYIPGSSIKGAIRTAVLATCVQAQPYLKTSWREAEDNAFGRDPQEDIFRYVKVGDAFFGENKLEVHRMESLNIRDNNGFWDTTKTQLVETLCAGDYSSFSLGLDTKQLMEKARQIPCLHSVEALFKAINSHTIRLLEEEIKRWKEEAEKDKEGIDKVERYLESLASVLEEAKAWSISSSTQETSCIMRVGYGSGWRFITGAWTEGSYGWDEIVSKSRPNNGIYRDYVFPKTRRIGNEYYDSCDVLGFVKLTYKKPSE